MMSDKAIHEGHKVFSSVTGEVFEMDDAMLLQYVQSKIPTLKSGSRDDLLRAAVKLLAENCWPYKLSRL